MSAIVRHLSPGCVQVIGSRRNSRTYALQVHLGRGWKLGRVIRGIHPSGLSVDTYPVIPA